MLKVKHQTHATLACLIAAAMPASAHAVKGMTRPETKMVRAINGMRLANGLPKLRPNRSLARAADDHSEDMGSNSFFAHTSYNGTDAYSRVMGYIHKRLMGETLAYMPMGGNGRPRRILRLWRASDPHRATLLTRRFRRVGIGRAHGFYNGQRVVFWTADLTSAR
jgi:uncharacterized protein YkwD